MPRVIVSGNSSFGLAQDIETVFPHAQFCSRSTSGHDFTKHEDQMAFAQLTLDYDVYISCSGLSQFGQVLLLEKVYTLWESKGKPGQILCMGCPLDQKVAGTSWTYPVEKRALRDYCANLNLAIKGREASAIKVTYINPGLVNSPQQQEKYSDPIKTSSHHIAKMLKWIVEQPPECNVSEIRLNPLPVDS